MDHITLHKGQLCLGIVTVFTLSLLFLHSIVRIRNCKIVIVEK